jgi:hypothetical protein
LVPVGPGVVIGLEGSVGTPEGCGRYGLAGKAPLVGVQLAHAVGWGAKPTVVGQAVGVVVVTF